MDDNVNGETTDDGLQETYERALFTLVMTHFEPGEVPLMVQRAYLGDNVVPSWESLTPPAGCSYCTDSTPCDYHAGQSAAPEPQQPEPQEQAAILIPVRHPAATVPAWRKALIQVLAAGIARLA